VPRSKTPAPGSKAQSTILERVHETWNIDIVSDEMGFFKAASKHMASVRLKAFNYKSRIV
jgi:hypothetical protein